MNAREVMNLLNEYAEDSNMPGEMVDTILSALRLLAAAEANDGTSPETDAESWYAKPEWKGGIEICEADFARRLERERNGLAARVGELEPDAERYRWLRDSRFITLGPKIGRDYEAKRRYILGRSAGGCVNGDIETLDAAIDAAMRSKP